MTDSLEAPPPTVSAMTAMTVVIPTGVDALNTVEDLSGASGSPSGGDMVQRGEYINPYDKLLESTNGNPVRTTESTTLNF